MTALDIIVLLAIFAPLIAPYDPNQQQLTVEARRQPPSTEHIFGTDTLGRDLFSRVLYAARTTILFTVVVIVTVVFLARMK